MEKANQRRIINLALVNSTKQHRQEDTKLPLGKPGKLLGEQNVAPSSPYINLMASQVPCPSGNGLKAVLDLEWDTMSEGVFWLQKEVGAECWRSMVAILRNKMSKPFANFLIKLQFFSLLQVM
ncbi:unnamed protein product [Lepeophtheirus salmonis]|uniref:(salmon louse) hypothetical protein n=1 Tax=Lepeophtheirus salmonis TaxID=72036 RepID=A0A7R8CCB6_LEPSM|nr:unnamed protein product [Lepeophtheirus salmonis]CAF2764291.1 unnamed protein product [Lepeophtheirus salmonis]